MSLNESNFVDQVAERLEAIMRSETKPWPEDPDGFYRSSAYHHATEIAALMCGEEDGMRLDPSSLRGDLIVLAVTVLAAVVVVLLAGVFL